jgi:putative transposase
MHRPISASYLAVETHENWVEAHRYLNMNDLREHKKTNLSHP